MADKYQNSSVISGRAGSIVMNHSDGREHIIIGAYSGSQLTLNGPGVSLFSPNNTQHHTIVDSFKSVGKDDCTYVGGDKWTRVEKSLNVIIGDSGAIKTEAHAEWNRQVTEYAMSNCLPPEKKPVQVVMPGVAIEKAPVLYKNAKIELASNTGIDQIKANEDSGKTSNHTATPPNALQQAKAGVKNVYSNLKKMVTGPVKTVEDITKGATDSLKGLTKNKLPLPKALSNLESTSSPSTAGAKAEPGPSPSARAEATANTQKKLTAIESKLGSGGDYVLCASRNIRIVCGATTNDNPQAYVDMKGRDVPFGVAVTTPGLCAVPSAAPEIVEVDNHSFFPCGKFTIEAGNGMNIKAGGGGIGLTTSGSFKLNTDTVLKIGALQTIIGGQDIIIKGETNLSIESSNLNITSEGQVFLNGNVGINQNLIVAGGGYFDGNITCNHIVAPQEIQQTLIGFTKEGARGFLRNGDQITGFLSLNVPATFNGSGGTLVVSNQPFTIVLDQQSGAAVELTPHGHEFPNIPITLIAGDSGNGVSANAGVRSSALVYNSNEPVGESGIPNVNKYPKSGISALEYIQNESSTSVNVTGV
jgi:hypothetical protein